MKILIVDDEPLARERLAKQISELADFEVAAAVENGKLALEFIERESPEIVLFDIRMPVMDGIEAARHLSTFENPPAIIFTTAYDQHALEAFEASAVDYLLKPVRKERLASALSKAKRLNMAQLAKMLMPANEAMPIRTHICVRSCGDLLLVPVDEIQYFHADQKYVTVVYQQGEVLIEESLKSLEAEFSTSLMRVHRGTLVATRYVQALEKTNEGLYLLKLSGVAEGVEVSRRHLPELRKWLKQRTA
ncbi:Autolysis response regulater LytR [hydrothermal vent metagenome]|uniref:Autolysis response regulater LytR n=1 Tax=hydrothermal vent metagenome TaxID=652676 RepID=A0A3B0XXN9_9ZZZZ